MPMATTSAAASAVAAAAVKQTLPRSPPAAAVLRGPLFARVQTGLGRLVAQATATSSLNNNNNNNNTAPPTTTRLVNISHQAPFRWIPLPSSTVGRTGAAVCYSSNYGGGILPGDTYQTAVHVQSQARLGLLTQGSNRVYKRSAVHAQTPVSRVQAAYTVDAEGFLVVAPDPLTPFGHSQLQQHQDLYLHPDCSVCFIDWVAAGRLSQGERWHQAALTSTTRVFWNNGNDDDDDDNHANKTPILVDATRLLGENHANSGMDWSGVQFNAYATMILYGNQVAAVVERCRAMPGILAAPYTPTRDNDNQDVSTFTDQSQSSLPMRLAGPVLMGVTTTNEQVTVVRLAATVNEDLYRVFHDCLEPLAASFGRPFYQERIRAVHSAPLPLVDKEQNNNKDNKKPVNGSNNGTEAFPDMPATKILEQSATTSRNLSPKALWAAHLLTDSSLPTGGFAHSAGLEAAAQLQLVQTTNDIVAFTHATVQSTLQLVTPTLVQVHQASNSNQGMTPEKWSRIHQELHAILSGNGTACRASLDQGTSLWRLARQWTKGQTNDVHKLNSTGPNAHYASVFGLLTATWGLSVEETRHLLAYCIARDVVSAAVRLNLVGPLASVPLLAQAYTALEQLDSSKYSTTTAASTAPVLEALQPMHDLLAVRLFRT